MLDTDPDMGYLFKGLTNGEQVMSNFDAEKIIRKVTKEHRDYVITMIVAGFLATTLLAIGLFSLLGWAGVAIAISIPLFIMFAALCFEE